MAREHQRLHGAHEAASRPQRMWCRLSAEHGELQFDLQERRPSAARPARSRYRDARRAGGGTRAAPAVCCCSAAWAPAEYECIAFARCQRARCSGAEGAVPRGAQEPATAVKRSCGKAAQVYESPPFDVLGRTLAGWGREALVRADCESELGSDAAAGQHGICSAAAACRTSTRACLLLSARRGNISTRGARAPCMARHERGRGIAAAQSVASRVCAALRRSGAEGGRRASKGKCSCALPAVCFCFARTSRFADATRRPAETRRVPPLARPRPQPPPSADGAAKATARRRRCVPRTC